MAAPPRVVFQRRDRVTALPLYHSRYLFKKYTGERDFKSFFAELRGSTIFLYSDEKEQKYCERLEVHNLKSLKMDSSSYMKNKPVIFTLTLHNEEVQLKIENPNYAEEWRGFIHTVANLEIPSELQLLPGQILRLEEILVDERKRRAASFSHNPDLPLGKTASKAKSQHDYRQPQTPECFYEVSREQAEKMLEEHPEYGSIIMRPSAHADYAVTIRQQHPSGALLRNYKIHSSDCGFVIKLDDPVTVPNLSDVVEHFLKETNNKLKPFVKVQQYDTRIELPPPDCSTRQGPSHDSNIHSNYRYAPKKQ
ncbi:signal-transducing adaptor protein 1-like [Chanos chanos]|uniref:Signal-transducing adaptor protein 1-like n=1 Tax=Chanos chanos TaxID=29144 RepID=A0A6J2X0Z3_CHACN|nr:signal-transducing adaptor protein 1-like [Chanos chanos]